jgi:hypothetical protein
MVKRVTKWSPDTCGCIIHFGWDDDTTETDRVHTYEAYEAKCKEHEHLDGQELMDAVVAKNRAKNLAEQQDG